MTAQELNAAFAACDTLIDYLIEPGEIRNRPRILDDLDWLKNDILDRQPTLPTSRRTTT
jgi:hypothetical protein